MSKKLFTNKDVEILSNNKYVLNVSEKAITYTNEFKIHFIAEYSKGKTSRVIFEEAGFDVDIIGTRRIDCAGNRWRKAFNEHGVLGLDDTRRNNSGRPRERELTQEELIARKDAEIAYLKAEIELLKKLELRERQVNNYKLSAAEAFELITLTVNKLNTSNLVSHLCNTANVSRSGYYSYLRSTDQRLQREEQDLLLKDIILKAYNHRGYKRGSRSIKMTLNNEFNIIYSRKRIQRIMRSHILTISHKIYFYAISFFMRLFYFV